MTGQLALPVTLDEQIKCVERELELRRRVYPRRVADRKMTPERADYQIRAMQAVLETLVFQRDFHD
jgi:hypothetical protein